MDGIDVALLRSDGDRLIGPGPWGTFPYEPDLRGRLAAAVAAGEGAQPADVTALEAALTEAHARAALDLLAAHDVRVGAVDVVGFHGHTLWHRPDLGRTCQLGDGPLLARRLGVPVVSQFRTADMAAGGQGAPLAPLYHRALAGGLEPPLAVLNLGGVGNLTYLDGETVIAFDTGPANAPLDDWAARHSGRPFDEDGRLSAAGQVDAERLRRLLDHPYFDQAPPKSLDRNDFTAAMADGLAPADGAATLAAMVAGAVERGLPHLPDRPRRWLVTGGGRHNPTIMGLLRGILGVPVDPIEAAGFSGDALEAQAFAYLAVRALKGMPLSLPGTTGVPRPQTGGVVHRAPRPGAAGAVAGGLERVAEAAFAPVAEALAAGRIPGAALGLVTAAGDRAVRWGGRAQVHPTERPLQRSALFDLASLTKVMVTTVEILSLVEQGRLDLDDPLARPLPDLRRDDPEAPIRRLSVRDCLAHRTFLPAFAPIHRWSDDPDVLRALILQHDWPAVPPVYSDINFILLGLVVERKRGRAFRDLDLPVSGGLGFYPDPELCVATEDCPWRRRVLRGEVHDETAWALGGAAGHAGLFGTVDGVLDFAAALFAGALLGPAAMAEMRRPHGDERTLGWQRRHAGWTGGSLCSPETLGHTGFVGVGLYVDVARGLAWTLLTNRVHPSRDADTGIMDLRRTVGNIVAAGWAGEGC